MTTDKTEATAKKTAMQKAPATANRVVKAAAKPSAKNSGKATPKPVADKTKKTPKIKLVRDSFTIPQDEYQEIAKIKDAFLKTGLPVKKSEVVRAGLKALSALSIAQMKRLLTGLNKVKPARQG